MCYSVRRMKIMIVSMHRNTDPFHVLLTMRSWNGNETITSMMPDTSVYPNKATEEFMSRLYEASCLPQGYKREINLETIDGGIILHAKITFPSFDTEKAHNLRNRIARFIDGEENII